LRLPYGYKLELGPPGTAAIRVVSATSDEAFCPNTLQSIFIDSTARYLTKIIRTDKSLELFELDSMLISSLLTLVEWTAADNTFAKNTERLSFTSFKAFLLFYSLSNLVSANHQNDYWPVQYFFHTVLGHGQQTEKGIFCQPLSLNIIDTFTGISVKFIRRIS